MDSVWSRKNLDSFLQSALVLASVFFAFYGATKSLWTDEAYSILIAEKDFIEIIQALQNDTHPPLYYFILAVWMKIFGASEIAARSLSGVSYLAAVAATYKLGLEVVRNKRFALLCALLYAISPLATGTAQSARMYSLLGLFAVSSILLFVKVFLNDEKSRLNLCLFAIANVCGTFTQIWFFFLLAAQILTYILLFYPKRRVESAAIYLTSFTPFAVLWTPILLVQLQINATSWLEPAGIKDLITVLLGFYGERVALIFFSSLFATLVLSLQLWSRGSRRSKLKLIKQLFAQKRTLVFVLILTFSLLIPFILSQFKPIFGQTRYTIIALPAVVMLIALMLFRIASKFSVAAFSLLMTIVIGAAFVRYQNQPEPCSDRNLSTFVMQNAKDGDVLIFTSLSRTATTYYIQRAGKTGSYVEKTFPAEIDSHFGWRNEKQMLSESDKLENQAEDLLNELKTYDKENPRRIWVFYGIDKTVDDILKRKLDSNFTLTAEKDATCADEFGRIPEVFYTKILIYQ